MLSGAVRLRLKIRRCERETCARYRPKAEGTVALPQHEFRLDVVALVGTLHHRDHRSVPEIHGVLRERGVDIAERTVTNLLDRYDELLATSPARDGWLKARLAAQGRVVLALDCLQLDVGHEVLWVVRDVLSGEVVLARSLLSGAADDLAPLLKEAALPGVPMYEADRHAKKELKKQVRGVRRIERGAEGASPDEADLVAGYCSAVRSAITNDGRPPLGAPGLRLEDRLEAVADSLDRVAVKRGSARRSRACAC